jgi:hypothetical protein
VIFAFFSRFLRVILVVFRVSREKGFPQRKSRPSVSRSDREQTKNFQKFLRLKLKHLNIIDIERSFFIYREAIPASEVLLPDNSSGRRAADPGKVFSEA